MKTRCRIVLPIIFAMIFALGAFAQEGKEKKEVPKVIGSGAEIINQMEFLEGRFSALADAFPAKDYSWRPVKRVRSFEEVLAHIRNANYTLATVIGVPKPADLPNETPSGKKQLIVAMKKSFKHTIAVVKAMTDKDFDKSVNLFGTDTTHRGVLNFINGHSSQHLGQLIAYSRVYGIVPPWNANTNQ